MIISWLCDELFFYIKVMVTRKHNLIFLTWKCFLHLLAFDEWNHQSRVDSPHKGPLMRSFGDFFVVGRKELLRKQSSCHEFEMPWYSHDITSMIYAEHTWPASCRQHFCMHINFPERKFHTLIQILLSPCLLLEPTICLYSSYGSPWWGQRITVD